MSKILDMLKAQFPQTYLLLHRPAVGQGGYQDRFRRIQKELGITATDLADSLTPATLKARPNVLETVGEPETEPTPLPTTATDLDRERMMLATARNLIALGDQDGANKILRRLAGVWESSQVDSSDVEEATANLDAVLRKGKRARQEKAALRAIGRQRRSPKLTQQGAAKRSYRMFLLHHSAQVAGRKMAEKFGKDWKKLVAEK